ncbi:hypothetical protein CPB85DRAFT_1270936 [Mucidula mucida]|nr:hypothetical protein CPB85DRAFT_1270936 [Mucidula mucida]
MDFHPVDYSAAIIRPPSPTSSIGSTHPVDQTSLSDQEDVCSHPEFDLKWRQKIRLGEKREEEDDAEREVLLTRPKTPNSERTLLETVLGNLHNAVNQLKEDEVFERALLYGSHAAMDQTPSSNDVDIILQSMMTQKSSISPSQGEDSVMDTNGSLSTAGRRLKRH